MHFNVKMGKLIFEPRHIGVAHNNEACAEFNLLLKQSTQARAVNQKYFISPHPSLHLLTPVYIIKCDVFPICGITSNWRDS